jgi:hypothetical protein
LFLARLPRLFKVPSSKFKVEEQSAWKLRFRILAVAADNVCRRRRDAAVQRSEFKVPGGGGEMKRK